MPSGEMKSIKLEKNTKQLGEKYNNAEGRPTVERDISGGVQCCRWDEMFLAK